MGQQQIHGFVGIEDIGAQQELDEKYFIQKVKLGAGTHGTVWRAVDRETEKVVAVKQIESQVLLQKGKKEADKILKGVVQEVKVMQSCKHENIVEFLGAFKNDQDNIFLFLEYCEGGDFGDKLRQRGSSSKETEVRQWMRDILGAISYLHNRQICHRDIKPDNFLGVHQDSRRLKLADFGLAVSVESGTLLTERCGTPAFMSPEQHTLPPKGLSSGYDHAVDVWGAGVTMYCLLFDGRHPFVTDDGQLDLVAASHGKLTFPVASYSLFGSKPRWSTDAVDLCKRLAWKQSRTRILAREALKHRFLESVDSTINSSSAPAVTSTQTSWLTKLWPKFPPPKQTSTSSTHAASGGTSLGTDEIPTDRCPYEATPPLDYTSAQQALVYRGWPPTDEDLVNAEVLEDAAVDGPDGINASDIQKVSRTITPTAVGGSGCCESIQVYYIKEPIRALRIGGSIGCVYGNVLCRFAYPPPCVQVIEPNQLPVAEQLSFSTSGMSGLSSHHVSPLDTDSNDSLVSI